MSDEHAAARSSARRCYGLYHHRFRAALSMLGISWGIISVVMLLAYGNGFRVALDAGFRGAFSDGVSVAFPGQTSLQAGGERAGRASASRPPTSPTSAQLPLVEERQPRVHAGTSRSCYGNKQSSHLVRAVAASYGEMRSETPLAGRPVPRRRGRAAAPPRRVHRQRGAAQAVRRACRRSARRSA